MLTDAHQTTSAQVRRATSLVGLQIVKYVWKSLFTITGEYELKIQNMRQRNI